jgi:hypothetical protein
MVYKQWTIILPRVDTPLGVQARPRHPQVSMYVVATTGLSSNQDVARGMAVQIPLGTNEPTLGVAQTGNCFRWSWCAESLGTGPSAFGAGYAWG